MRTIEEVQFEADVWKQNALNIAAKEKSKEVKSKEQLEKKE